MLNAFTVSHSTEGSAHDPWSVRSVTFKNLKGQYATLRSSISERLVIRDSSGEVLRTVTSIVNNGEPYKVFCEFVGVPGKIVEKLIDREDRFQEDGLMFGYNY